MHKLQFLPAADQPIGVDETTSHRLGVEDHVPGDAHQDVPVVSRVGEAAHCDAGERKEVTVSPSEEQKRRRDGHVRGSTSVSLSLCVTDRSNTCPTAWGSVSHCCAVWMQAHTRSDEDCCRSKDMRLLGSYHQTH